MEKPLETRSCGNGVVHYNTFALITHLRSDAVFNGKTERKKEKENKREERRDERKSKRKKREQEKEREREACH